MIRWTRRKMVENFNPRSPHGERPMLRMPAERCWIFQSTLPARGATVLSKICVCQLRSSIHAPRTGSDWRFAHVVNSDNISIHAPRTGSDDLFNSTERLGDYFNPRSPHGERQMLVAISIDLIAFQSTLPARGATMLVAISIDLIAFQSTLPARGATYASHFPRPI